jgi:hypothetical protein
MNQSEDLEEKKLLGSCGYAFAKLTEQEEIKASQDSVVVNEVVYLRNSGARFSILNYKCIGKLLALQLLILS